MNDLTKFGRCVKLHRQHLKINAYNFAIAANIDFTQLSNIERGTNIPTIRVVVAILNALNMSFAECVNETNIIDSKEKYKNFVSNSLDSFSDDDLLYLLEIAKTFHKNIEV